MQAPFLTVSIQRLELRWTQVPHTSPTRNLTENPYQSEAIIGLARGLGNRAKGHRTNEGNPFKYVIIIMLCSIHGYRERREVSLLAEFELRRGTDTPDGRNDGKVWVALHDTLCAGRTTRGEAFQDRRPRESGKRLLPPTPPCSTLRLTDS